MKDSTIQRPDQLFDLSGKVAVVTGGSTHLGRAMASALAGAGATVHIASRNAQRCAAVAAELSAAGGDVRGGRCDISDPDEINSYIDSVVDQHNKVDIVICNSAARAWGPFMDLDMVTLRQNLETNILGTAECARAAARHMIPRGGGSIVLIGSTHGALGSDRRSYAPGFRGSAADYHIAKGAIVNMARALATEWSLAGIRVNCLSPGQTPQESTPIDQLEYFRAGIPLGYLGRSVDMMGPVLLLASDAGRFITGHNLIVDGGSSAW